jgi:hypothetical protein
MVLYLDEETFIVRDKKLVEKSRQHSNDHEEFFNDQARPHKLLRGGVHGGGTESQTA